MRSILALSLLIALGGVANAAQVHHAHRRHAIVHSNPGMFASGPGSSFAYAPPQPPTRSGAALYPGSNEPYFGASQGYAPGEKERFLRSLFSP